VVSPWFVALKFARVKWLALEVRGWIGWVEVRGWVGVDWVGLGWIGLDWVGLGLRVRRRDYRPCAFFADHDELAVRVALRPEELSR
jgi:hypothetical protein